MTQFVVIIILFVLFYIMNINVIKYLCLNVKVDGVPRGAIFISKRNEYYFFVPAW